MLLTFASAQAKAADKFDAGVSVQPGAASPVETPLLSALESDEAALAGTGAGEANAAMDKRTSSNASFDKTPASTTLATRAHAASHDVTPDTTPIAPTVSSQASAREPEAVQFNSGFLAGKNAAKTDISRFDKGNVALPGTYRSTLYVNGVWIGVTDVTLREPGAENHRVAPVFDQDLLMRVGIDLTRLSTTERARLDDAGKTGGVTLPELIPQATAAFDMGEQRLDVSVPQAMMSRNARGWVDPSLWDDGVPATTLQYNANVYHTNGTGLSNTQGYLGLIAGANVGPWRFRYNGNVTTATHSGTHAQSMQTYMQRSFTPIKSQLTVGDSFTDGSIFDSFGVRGMQIGTDDRMYPESQRGYAPTVRGIANSNANVQVMQNGNVIYETTVAPGPFEINDLYPTGYGGDLQVVVTEADGSRHVSSLPYAAPVNALREGRWRFNVAAGLYHNTSQSDQPFVFQTGLQHGLNNLVTVYGGTIIADGYASVALGAALDTTAGAFAFDVRQANTNLLSRGSRGGQSLRLAYSRNFAPTNTNVTLAAYRYSTNGFLDFASAMNLRDLASRGTAYTDNGIQKGRLQVTLNQSLDRYGAIYASGYTQNYWNKNSRDTSFQVGYNTNVGRVGVGVSAAREFDVGFARWSNRMMVNLSIPLDIGSSIANTATSFSHDSRDHSSQIQESFTGALGKDYEFSYGVTAGQTLGSSNATSVNANGGYLSQYTQVRANVGRANGYTQAGGGLSGSVVAYGDGVVLTPQTGDTFAVVEAKDAIGARVASSPGVRIDRFGHAAVSGMQPYSLNSVDIDTKGLPMGVQLKTTEQRFAPTAGAVSRVKFDTENRGRAIVMRLRRASGEAVPFGADVLNANGDSIGTVTQGSRAMFYSKSEGRDLTAKWGAGADQKCAVRYSLPAVSKDKMASTTFADAVCQ